MPHLEYLTRNHDTGSRRRVRLTWDEEGRSPAISVEEPTLLWPKQFPEWKQKHQEQVIEVPTQWPQGCRCMIFERRWSGDVPRSVVKNFLAWIQKNDFLAPQKAESWVTCAPSTRIEWPLNDRVQAYFDYYEGTRPEDQRVVEFERRLDRIAKRYAHDLTEWLWDEREYWF